MAELALKTAAAVAIAAAAALIFAQQLSPLYQNDADTLRIVTEAL